MRNRRLGLIVGTVAAILALGLGLYMLGATSDAEQPQSGRFTFLVIPALALGGGWMASWNSALAAVLLAAGALLALFLFGLSLPALILAALLGGAALMIWMMEF